MAKRLKRHALGGTGSADAFGGRAIADYARRDLQLIALASGRRQGNAGEVGNTVSPRSASRAFSLGSARPALISWLSFSRSLLKSRCGAPKPTTRPNSRQCVARPTPI
jgi:hypothetical protein